MDSPTLPRRSGSTSKWLTWPWLLCYCVCAVVLLFSLPNVSVSYRTFVQVSQTRCVQGTPPENIPKIDCKQIHSDMLKVPFPKILHFVWFNETMSEELQANIRSCQKVNPTYEIHVWNETRVDNLITSHYSWFRNHYHSYRHKMQRVDIARYVALLHYGGIYIDLDCTCNVPFDKVLRNMSNEKTVVLGTTSPCGVTNAMLMAKPHHPFFHSLLEHAARVSGINILPYWQILTSTGPLLVTRTMYEYACSSHIHLMPYSEYDHGFITHHHAGSWHKADGKLIHVLYEGWPFIKVLLILLPVLAVFALAYIYCRPACVKFPPKSKLQNP